MISESQLYADRLRAARAQIWKTLDGLRDDALNWHPTPDASNSLFALATHCLGAERRWIHQVVGGRTIVRDRDAEFRALAENLATLETTYADVALETERVLNDLTLEAMAALKNDGRNEYSARWCILHVVEHYSEHIGQMALTRQLWENRNARLNEI
ncbi:MAG: DUF664 domain-containing protein [Chloroflexi bacterium]|nr:DUF664 domain-containing protein [Chloroflexota bacterium]